MCASSLPIHIYIVCIYVCAFMCLIRIYYIILHYPTLSCCDFLALTSETRDHAVIFPLFCFSLTMHCFKSLLSTFQTHVMSQLINDTLHLVHLSSNQTTNLLTTSEAQNTDVSSVLSGVFVLVSVTTSGQEKDHKCTHTLST